MELQHQFTVPAPVDTAWETFMDLAGVAACFPGATVTSVEGDSFEGSVKVKLGPIALLYTGAGHFQSRDDSGHRAVIEAKGKDKRGNGTAGATVTLACTEAGPSQTSVEVSTDLSVTGKPAQFGRGVMQDVSDKLLQQFVACLETRFAESPTETSPAETATTAAVGSEAAAPATESTRQPTPESPAAPAPPAPPARAVDRPAFVSADAGAGGDALDLGSTVIPVLLRSYAPHLVAGAVGFVLGLLVARSRRR